MKTYKTLEEVEKDIKDGVLTINDDVKFECDISIKANINAVDIDAKNINALDINAGYIDAGDIDAKNINAKDINALDINASNINASNIDAGDIDAGDIDALNIDAGDIDARNINAVDINAWNILYYAFCCVYNSINCKSIKARRSNHKEPICLDGKLIIKEDDKIEELTMEDVCKELGRNIKIKK